MSEIRLTVDGFWDDKINADSDIDHINSNIKNNKDNKDKKIVIDLPITYFDDSLLDKIYNVESLEFESKDGRRFNSKDIESTNNKFNNILKNVINDELSPFERFIAIYSFVVNYKPYKLGDKKYNDVGRSPYLFLEDDYINCVGFCQFLCILCRKAGINITMLADEEKEHALCYCYIKDETYGIDGYFVSDPTNDSISEDKMNCSYVNMIGRILFNNEFEKFLNSDRKLSFPNDMQDISLFSKYISFLKTNDFMVGKVDNTIDSLYAFRDEFKTKENCISYDTIYNAIMNVSQQSNISTLDDDKGFLKELLFLKEFKEKTIALEPTENLVKSFIGSSGSKKY